MIEQSSDKPTPTSSSQASDSWQAVFMAADIAILVLDRDLRIQHFTPRASELFNLHTADYGRPLTELTYNLNYSGLLDDVSEVLHKITPLEREVSSDGAHWQRMQMRPYFGAQDTVEGVVITFMDITQLKQAEQALRASEEWAKLIVENVKEYAIFTLNKAGQIATWNPGAERILQYTDDEAIGQTGAIIFTPEDRAAGAVEYEIGTAVRHGQALDERWHIRKDGSRFWGSGVMTALHDEAGELRGFVKVMRDNTERQQAEEQLRASQEQLQALNASLAERVKARTQQVRNLAAELVLAEQKERQRIAHILHDDVQQLLYSLQIELSLLPETLPADDTINLTQLSQTLQAPLTQAIRLTRQLALDLTPPVLANEGLVEMLDWLALHMQQLHGLAVTVVSQANLLLPSREISVLLIQIVRELLFNVVKHAGVKQANVVLYAVSDGLAIEVSDEGRGFDPPESASISQTTGYGLPSVQARMLLVGGRMVIDARRGAGTRIILHVLL